MADQAYNQIVVGFIRKRDGQLMTVKLLELFKQLQKADFTNNEITLNGEVCVLDSFQQVITDVTLGIRFSYAGGFGVVNVNGIDYTGDVSILCKVNDLAKVQVTAVQGSIQAITDELGNPVPHDHGRFDVLMDRDHIITIVFGL